MKKESSSPLLGGGKGSVSEGRRKARLKIYGILALVLLAGFLVVDQFRKGPKKDLYSESEQVRATLSEATNQESWTIQSGAEIDKLKRSVKTLEKNVTDVIKELKETNQHLKELQGEVGKVSLQEGKRGIVKSEPPLKEPGLKAPIVAPPSRAQRSSSGSPTSLPTKPPPGKRQVLEEGPLRPLVVLDMAPAEVPSTEKVQERLPRGSILPIRLLTGMDVPTGKTSQKNPTPVLMEVTDLSILPNQYQMDFRKCFIIGEARGVVSTERAVVRSVGMSCVNEGEEAIDIALAGSVMGEDGKQGFRGIVVLRDGALLARALLAGFVEGVGQAFQPYSRGLNLNVAQNPNQALTLPDPSNVGVIGLAGAASGGARILAQRYIELANQIFPVIEIKAAREGTLVVLEPKDGKGFDLEEGSE